MKVATIHYSNQRNDIISIKETISKLLAFLCIYDKSSTI